MLYSFLILPTDANVTGINPVGVGWFLLSISLLFLVPLAYHAFTIFGLLWAVYEGVTVARGNLPAIFDVGVALGAVALVMTSGYLHEANEAQGELEPAP
jgi:hypothetical protein